MTYRTPAAFRAAVMDRAKRRARDLGANSADLVEHFYFQRLLARIYIADPDGWLLKGGQALLVRYPDARHSRDIDLYRPTTTDLDEAIAALRAAAELDLGDHLRFEFVATEVVTEAARSLRVSFEVFAGNNRVALIKIDLTVDLCPIGIPAHRPLEPVVPIDWPADWPEVLLYPIVDHTADKIAAMYELHGEMGTPSSRHRDLVDLVLIALKEPIDGRGLQTALRSEVSRRRDLGVALELPVTFTLPHPSWGDRYRKDAAKLPDLARHRTVEDATQLMTAFLDPLLAPATPGWWNPAGLRWTAELAAKRCDLGH